MRRQAPRETAGLVAPLATALLVGAAAPPAPSHPAPSRGSRAGGGAHPPPPPPPPADGGSPRWHSGLKLAFCPSPPRLELPLGPFGAQLGPSPARQREQRGGHGGDSDYPGRHEPRPPRRELGVQRRRRSEGAED